MSGNGIQPVEEFRRFTELECFKDKKFSKRVFVDLAQKIISDLCKQNRLPSIPVIFCERFPRPNAGAMYKDYQILINYSTDAHTLIHEFHHYVVDLFGVMEDLEERMVERATFGYVKELKSESNELLADI